MNVPNGPLLKSMRSAGVCELCGAFCFERCAAHIFSVGAGRVDHLINLVAVGLDPIRDCSCHHDSHATKKPSREDFLRVAAKRQGIPAESIKPIVDAVRACPRKSTFEAASVWLREAFDREVAESAIEIIRRVYES